jgi:hypothetical protein
MAKTVDIGIERYKSTHPLHPSNDGSTSPLFKGQSNPHRNMDHVHNDIMTGHKILGTDLHGMADMNPTAQHSSHGDAEMIGYHANKHNYLK